MKVDNWMSPKPDKTLTWALEVWLGRKKIRTCLAAPGGYVVGASLANVPRTYMRAFVSSSSDKEEHFWQLPDIAENQRVSFRLVRVASGDAPLRIRRRTASELRRLRAQGKRAYARAVRASAAKATR